MGGDDGGGENITLQSRVEAMRNKMKHKHFQSTLDDVLRDPPEKIETKEITTTTFENRKEEEEDETSASSPVGLGARTLSAGVLLPLSMAAAMAASDALDEEQPMCARRIRAATSSLGRYRSRSNFSHFYVPVFRKRSVQQNTQWVPLSQSKCDTTGATPNNQDIKTRIFPILIR